MEDPIIATAVVPAIFLSAPLLEELPCVFFIIFQYNKFISIRASLRPDFKLAYLPPAGRRLPDQIIHNLFCQVIALQKRIHLLDHHSVKLPLFLLRF